MLFYFSYKMLDCIIILLYISKFSPMEYYESQSEVTQSCPTLCDPMDCSLPSSSVHGILQARILEWVGLMTLQYCPWFCLNWEPICVLPEHLAPSRPWSSVVLLPQHCEVTKVLWSFLTSRYQHLIKSFTFCSLKFIGWPAACDQTKQN